MNEREREREKGVILKEKQQNEKLKIFYFLVTRFLICIVISKRKMLALFASNRIIGRVAGRIRSGRKTSTISLTDFKVLKEKVEKLTLDVYTLCSFDTRLFYILRFIYFLAPILQRRLLKFDRTTILTLTTIGVSSITSIFAAAQFVTESTVVYI